MDAQPSPARPADRRARRWKYAVILAACLVAPALGVGTAWLGLRLGTPAAGAASGRPLSLKELEGRLRTSARESIAEPAQGESGDERPPR